MKNGLSCNQLNGRQSNPPTNAAYFFAILFRLQWITTKIVHNNDRNELRLGLVCSSHLVHFLDVAPTIEHNQWTSKTSINTKTKQNFNEIDAIEKMRKDAQQESFKLFFSCFAFLSVRKRVSQEKRWTKWKLVFLIFV